MSVTSLQPADFTVIICERITDFRFGILDFEAQRAPRHGTTRDMV
jgi:hypothetical protein